MFFYCVIALCPCYCEQSSSFAFLFTLALPQNLHPSTKINIVRAPLLQPLLLLLMCEKKKHTHTHTRSQTCWGPAAGLAVGVSCLAIPLAGGVRPLWVSLGLHRAVLLRASPKTFGISAAQLAMTLIQQLGMKSYRIDSNVIAQLSVWMGLVFYEFYWGQSKNIENGLNQMYVVRSPPVLFLYIHYLYIHCLYIHLWRDSTNNSKPEIKGQLLFFKRTRQADKISCLPWGFYLVTDCFWPNLRCSQL